MWKSSVKVLYCGDRATSSLVIAHQNPRTRSLSCSTSSNSTTPACPPSRTTDAASCSNNSTCRTRTGSRRRPHSTHTALAADALTPADLLDRAKVAGYEGLIAKRRASRYHPGQRSLEWRKHPLIQTQEVIVGGWLAPSKGQRCACRKPRPPALTCRFSDVEAIDPKLLVNTFKMGATALKYVRLTFKVDQSVR